VEDIRTFHRQGLSISEIHRLTGFDHKTIRKYVLHAGRPRYRPRAPRVSTRFTTYDFQAVVTNDGVKKADSSPLHYVIKHTGTHCYSERLVGKVVGRANPSSAVGR